MKPLILLVNPWIHDFTAHDLWLKPLGLLYLKSILEKRGFDTVLADALGRTDPCAETMRPGKRRMGCGRFCSQEIDKPPAYKLVPRKYKRFGLAPKLFQQELQQIGHVDAVAVSSGMTYWYPGLVETIAVIRPIFPATPIILGGIYATLCPDHAVAKSGADYVVPGSNPEDFVSTLCDLTGFRVEHLNSNSFADYPWPAYDDLTRLDSVSIMTSRGCPMKCSYCASRLLFSSFEQRPYRDVVDEIQHWTEKLRIQDIAFYDDALLLNAESHIKPLLDEVMHRNLSVRMHSPNGLHAALIDRELADLMRQANFTTVRLSFESMGPSRWEDSSRKVNAEQFSRAVSCLVEAGYSARQLEAYVLVGLPDQDSAEVEDACRFVNSCGVTVRLAEFSPVPGTREFEKALGNARFDPGEPLHQDNSVYPWMFGPFTLAELQSLKQMVNSMNAALRACPEASRESLDCRFIGTKVS